MLKRLFLVAAALTLFVGCTESYWFEATTTETPAALYSTQAVSSDLADWQVGRKVLFFTNKRCAECQRQRPGVMELRERGGAKGLGVVEIDSDEHPEMVARFGIDKYPTYVVCEDGEVRGVAISLKTTILIIKIIFKIAVFLTMFVL